MKLKNLTYGLLASAMLVSCSDDMNVNGPAANGGENLTTGFIGVTIGMPSDGATRANDDFNHGTGGENGTNNEYGVTSAAILFFTGPTEAGATFYRAYNIGQQFDKPTESDQITRKKTAAFPVDFAKDASDRLWAMAVLNYDGIITIENNRTDAEGKELGAVVKIGEDPLPSGTTIEDFMKLTTSNALYKTIDGKAQQFFMVNTPYSRVPGGTVAPAFRPDGENYFKVLADVDRSKIFETEDQATANPATEIFVERAVAKVEVLTKAEDLTKTLGIEGIEVAEVKWLIDNTEPMSYLVRNHQQVENGYGINSIPSWANYVNDGNYRFIGSASFKDLAKYRTYFGEDPNGAGVAVGTTGLSHFYDLDVIPAFKSSGDGYPQYCHENTFSVQNMNTFNTTCAVIEVTYRDNKGNAPTFYTIGLNNKQMFTYENAARVLAVAVISEQSLSDAWTNYFNSLKEPYDNGASTLNLVYDDELLTATNAWMKIQFSKADGRLTVADLTLYDGNLNNAEKKELPKEFFSDEVKAKAIADINKAEEIKAYSEGKSYYRVLIKHFGDDYTPWTSNLDNTPTTAESYPGYDNDKYLGRYGVLRNNWYRINITKINNLGEPTYKDIKFDGTPDDKVEKEEAISCRINILSWTLRDQYDEL